MTTLVSTAQALPVNFYGLHWNGTYTTDENDWNAIKNSGADIFRLQISWNYLESKGNWRESPAWEQTYDKYFELATKSDVSILPYIYGRRTSAAHTQFYLSNEWSEWLEFVWTVVQRYGRGGTFWDAHPELSYRPVLIWEVWNEPNLAGNNPGETVLPQKYAEFLITTSNTIQSAQNAVRNPGEPTDTQVLHGGLYQPGGTNVWTYMEKAAKISGYAASFNGLSLHPYSFNGNEAEKLAGVALNLDNAREALNAFAGTAKTIWITELGWQVAYNGPDGQPPVSETEQANLLNGIFNWLEEKVSLYNLSLVTWYFYRDINVANWAYHTGLRRENGSYRPSWWAYLGQTGVPAWPQFGTDELGFVRFNGLSKTSLTTYVGAPTYKGLWTIRDTGFPAVSDPQNVQALAIDTNGDGTDELGFVRYNGASGNTELTTYSGPPDYTTLLSAGPTGYPSISDPQNVQAIAVDTNGDYIDELGFLRFNHSSGNTELVLYKGAPGYTTLLSAGPTGYPSISDPQNVQAVVLDNNADAIDELGFLRFNHSSGNTELVLYNGAPTYKSLISASPTGYPAISDPNNVQGFTIDINGNGTDELGFLRYNHSSGYTELVTYGGTPTYKVLVSASPTGYPAASDPQNVQGVAIDANADPNPGRWYTDNLGGNYSGARDIASRESEGLHVFARGTDDALQVKYFSKGAWSGWINLGGKMASGPGAVSWGPGRMDVVARAADNTVTHWWYDGSWHSGDNLGGNVVGDPDIASRESEGLHVFARGTDDALQVKYFSKGAWSGWINLGGKMASGPGAVSWGPGRMDVVARAADNTVTHWWYDGSWHSGDNLGGNVVGDPDIASWTSGRLDVFAMGPDGSLQHKWYGGGAWSSWESLGTGLTASPGAVSWGPNRIDVAARTTDGSTKHWWYLDP